MKLYSLFVSDKLNASLKQLFMKNNAKKDVIDLQDNLQAIELIDHSQDEESESSNSGSINIDDISDASSSGGGTSSDTSSEKENFKILKI